MFRIWFRDLAPFTQDAEAHLHANPLMLLAICVNTPIDCSAFHNLHTHCCEVVCVLCERGQRPSYARAKENSVFIPVVWLITQQASAWNGLREQASENCSDATGSLTLGTVCRTRTPVGLVKYLMSELRSLSIHAEWFWRRKTRSTKTGCTALLCLTSRLLLLSNSEKEIQESVLIVEE